MSRQILAIDIRSNLLSVVQLATGIKSIVVETAELIPLNPDLDKGDPLYNALTQLSADIDLADAAVVVGLPAEKAIFRSLSLPFKDERKIRQILAFELEPVLPIPVDQLIIDFQQIPREDEGAWIFSASIDRPYLNKVLSSFSSVGISPQFIAPGGIALATVFTAQGSELPAQYMVLDSDSDKAALLAISNGNILFSRSIQINKSVEDAWTTLAHKINQTLSGYNDRNNEAFSPAAMFISGSGYFGIDPVKPINEILNLDCRQINLSNTNLRVEFADSVTHWQPGQFDGALALALIEAEGRRCIQFHRSGSAFRSIWANYKPHLRGPAVLVALLAVLFLMGTWLDIHRLQQRIDTINDEISAAIHSSFPEVQKISDRPADQMRSKLEEFKKQMVDPTLGGDQPRIIDILNQVSQMVPESSDVMLNRMVVGRDGITIAGITNDFNTVDDIKSRLEKSELFNTVTIAAANMDKSGNKVRFRLKIDV